MGHYDTDMYKHVHMYVYVYRYMRKSEYEGL